MSDAGNKRNTGQWGRGQKVEALIVQAINAMLASLFPYQPPPGRGKEELMELGKRYRWVGFLFFPIFLIFTGVFTWAWGSILNDVAEWRLSLLPPSVFLMKPAEPYWAFWLFPGFFLGSITAGLPASLIVRLILGRDRYADYRIGSQARSGVDDRKVMRPLIGGILLLVAVWTTLALDWYTRFEEQQMAINPLLGWGETIYPYTEVTHLVETTHLRTDKGNIVYSPRWFIVFRDGQRWCNADLGSGGRQEPAGRSLREFLSKKAEKQFEKARFLEEALGDN
jgi:hypothetical protein